MAEHELIFTSQYCRMNCLNIDNHIEIQTPQDPNREIYGVDGTTFTDPRQYVPKELYGYLDIFDDRKAKKMPQPRICIYYEMLSAEQYSAAWSLNTK
jgi:hypothetical protein